MEKFKKEIRQFYNDYDKSVASDKAKDMIRKKWNADKNYQEFDMLRAYNAELFCAASRERNPDCDRKINEAEDIFEKRMLEKIDNEEHITEEELLKLVSGEYTVSQIKDGDDLYPMLVESTIKLGERLFTISWNGNINGDDGDYEFESFEEIT